MKINRGDIIKLDLDPVKGVEQHGFRPALVISNNFFNKVAKLLIVMPITNTNKGFPLHLPLDDRTKTTGVILCEHARTIDPTKINVKFIEKAPDDLVEKAIDILVSTIE